MLLVLFVLVMFRLPRRFAFGRLFKTVEVLDNCGVFKRFGKMQWCLFVFVDQVELAASVDQELAHFKLPLASSVEKAGLGVLIEVVDVDSVPEQQFGNLEPAVTGSPVERVLVVLIGVVQVEVKVGQQAFDYLCPPLV